MDARKLTIGIGAALLLILAYNAAFKWPARKQAIAKQEKLIAAMEGRKWGRIQRLCAEDYADSLGLDRDNLLLALKDVGFLTRGGFSLNWELISVERDGDAVVITGNMHWTGGIGPGASAVESYSRSFAKQPFTFRWEKTGFLPWAWQLKSASHPKAKLPADYSPGDVIRMADGGGF